MVGGYIGWGLLLFLGMALIHKIRIVKKEKTPFNPTLFKIQQAQIHKAKEDKKEQMTSDSTILKEQLFRATSGLELLRRLSKDPNKNLSNGFIQATCKLTLVSIEKVEGTNA